VFPNFSLDGVFLFFAFLRATLILLGAVGAALLVVLATPTEAWSLRWARALRCLVLAFVTWSAVLLLLSPHPRSSLFQAGLIAFLASTAALWRLGSRDRSRGFAARRLLHLGVAVGVAGAVAAVVLWLSGAA
jgi:hypothetical protein